MFGRIAGVYDLLNHVLSLGIDYSWRRSLAELAPGGTILDLAAGTLDVSLALRKAHPEATIFAMDFCLPMLEQGMKKLKNPDVRESIAVVNADARSLPLPGESVDGITMAFGIRNITPRREAFVEMLRVLKPGGRMCILEFGSASERIWGGLYNFYLKRILPAIGKAAARDEDAYSYLARTIQNFPTAQRLASEIGEAGFANVEYMRLTGGIVCLHWGEKRAISST